MKVPFSTLTPLHDELHDELSDTFETVLKKGWFIQGKECELFEKEFAEFCSAKHCIGCGNGLDAISIALMANGIGAGDEVIVPAFTFIATALAVERIGAKPVFVDVEKDTTLIDVNKVEEAITEKTKAIVPVHLYGQPVDIDSLLGIARSYNLKIIFDAAQAHGATYKSKNICCYGDASCFSFYPGKNLGALGDGGAVVTNLDNYNEMKMIGNYGAAVRYHHDLKGLNSRLDELQSAFLRIKLKKIDAMTQARKKLATRYLKEIDNPAITLPVVKNGDHVWHIFAVHCETRDVLQKTLKEFGIETNIHYPIPIHLQKSFMEYGCHGGEYPVTETLARTELSLPLFYGMTENQQTYVIDALNKTVI